MNEEWDTFNILHKSGPPILTVGLVIGPLAVHSYMFDEWAVSHRITGRRIAAFKTERKAIRIARKLAVNPLWDFRNMQEFRERRDELARQCRALGIKMPNEIATGQEEAL